jgi:hypothetical protein
VNEPYTDFDYEAVDDPEGVALEELLAIASRRGVHTTFDRKQAAIVLAWASMSGIGPKEPIIERLALWLGGGARRQDMALRTAVLVREYAPSARHAYNLRQIGQFFGVTKQAIYKHTQHLRATVEKDA